MVNFGLVGGIFNVEDVTDCRLTAQLNVDPSQIDDAKS